MFSGMVIDLEVFVRLINVTDSETDRQTDRQIMLCVDICSNNPHSALGLLKVLVMCYNNVKLSIVILLKNK